MFHKEFYRKNELALCEWQYADRCKFNYEFTIGEKVFLASNPEIDLIVVGFNKDNVKVSHNDIISEFPPPCLIKIRFGGNIIHSRANIRIYLN